MPTAAGRSWVYPRACGGTASFRPGKLTLRGLSPRVRGNLKVLVPAALQAGSIPARAGEPAPAGCCRRGSTVYPRACGGTPCHSIATHLRRGLSPRVRGNLRRFTSRLYHAGSIPARAGEPNSAWQIRRPRPVYPRACGGTINGMPLIVCENGLSPRVRGNQLRRPHRQPHRGVYPRACGGTPWPPGRERPTRGLSPRVRGNPALGSRYPEQGGSIPARAGEPTCGPRSTRWNSVYPRACGGTTRCGVITVEALGLSPRVRGNLQGVADLFDGEGSIPARAGEPSRRCTKRQSERVYPRACGGTVAEVGPVAAQGGLSPRVRGNRGHCPQG